MREVERRREEFRRELQQWSGRFRAVFCAVNAIMLRQAEISDAATPVRTARVRTPPSAPPAPREARPEAAGTESPGKGRGAGGPGGADHRGHPAAAEREGATGEATPESPPLGGEERSRVPRGSGSRSRQTREMTALLAKQGDTIQALQHQLREMQRELERKVRCRGRPGSHSPSPLPRARAPANRAKSSSGTGRGTTSCARGRWRSGTRSRTSSSHPSPPLCKQVGEEAAPGSVLPLVPGRAGRIRLEAGEELCSVSMSPGEDDEGGLEGTQPSLLLPPGAPLWCRLGSCICGVGAQGRHWNEWDGGHAAESPTLHPRGRKSATRVRIIRRGRSLVARRRSCAERAMRAGAGAGCTRQVPIPCHLVLAAQNRVPLYQCNTPVGDDSHHLTSFALES